MRATCIQCSDICRSAKSSIAILFDHYHASRSGNGTGLISRAIIDDDGAIEAHHNGTAGRQTSKLTLTVECDY